MARSRWRRRVLRSLVLGVLSSVALALAVAVLGGNARTRPSATVSWRSRQDFRVSLPAGLLYRTTTVYKVLVPSHTDPGDPLEATVLRHLGPARADRYLAPGAPQPIFTDPAAANMGYPVRFILITTSGVPFEAFWGYFGDDCGTAVTGGSWLPFVAPASRGPYSRVFPYRPLWSGVGANAALHAAAWAGLFSLARAGVRRRRAGRGRCLECGYDRRGLAAGAVCPECGAGA